MRELAKWRESVNDPGITEEFREGGWPSTYPTRSPEEWTEIVGKWENWFFPKPGEIPEWPQILPIPGAEYLKLIR
jgi:hypothetical protein